MRQIEAKLINKHNAINIIESSTWSTSLTINRHKYIIIEKSMIAHDAVVWYTFFEIKNNRKEVVFKLKTIQEKILKRIVDVYKTTTIEMLKMKIYVFLINIHLKNLLQNLIINMNIKQLINVVDTTVKRIRKNLMSKRKRKLKLCTISLQTKKRWMRQ